MNIMKKTFPFFLLLASFIAIGQTPCLNGMAGDYPCNGYDLQSFIPFSTFNASPEMTLGVGQIHKTDLNML